MDLKRRFRDVFISEVLGFGYSSDVWRMFIYDASTVKFLNSVFSFGELLERNVVGVQTLEDELRVGGEDFGALYLVRLDESRLRLILKEVRRRRYKKFWVVLVEQSDLAERLAGEDVFVKVVNLHFSVIAKNGFLFERVEDLNGVFSALELGVNVHYVPSLEKEARAIRQERGKRNADVILVNRGVDLLTPFMHFYDFYSLLNDLKILKGEFLVERKMHLEKGAVWNEIKFVHIAEINSVLSKKAHRLVKGVKKLDGELSFKDLSKMVLEAPENIRLKEEVMTFLDLADQVITAFKENSLDAISEFEQSLATGYTPEGEKYKSAHEDFLRLLDSHITKENKLRLFLQLHCASKLTPEILAHIQKKSIFTQQEIELTNKLTPEKKNSKPKSYSYAISRHTPTLYGLAHAFLKNKKFHIPLKTTTKENRPTTSIRKTEFIFQPNNDSTYRKKQILVLIMLNGLSHPELSFIEKLQKETGIDIIIGTDQINTPEDFIEYLKENKQNTI